MGYGTGATLKATADAYNKGVIREEGLQRSEQQRELAGKRDARAEERMGMQRENFNAQREMRERQRQLLEDAEAQQKFKREMNRGMATAQATDWQVYQPIVNTYNELMPDGGRINSVVRHPDGRFDVEYDLNGQRMSLKDQTGDDLGSFFMSMADPEGFLNMQRDLAASAAEQAAAERLERLKSELDRKPTPAQFTSAYETYSELYDKAFTAGDGLGGMGEPLPGAPPREQWISERMTQAGFTHSGRGGTGGAIPGSEAESGERSKALNALADAFSSMPRLREYLREGGLPVEKLEETVGGSGRLMELERAMLDNNEQSAEVLAKHVRQMAARLGVADISDEEVERIVGNRRIMPSGQSGSNAEDTTRAVIGGLTSAAPGVPSLGQLGYQAAKTLIEGMDSGGPVITPSGRRLSPQAEAQIVAPNEELVAPQGVLPTPR